jgi:hypothetical protein
MDPQLTVMAQTASATVVALMATDVWQRTRRRIAVHGAASRPLGVLDVSDAVDVLLDFQVRDADPAALEQLAHSLGCHPLALMPAGTYLGQQVLEPVTAHDYLQDVPGDSGRPNLALSERALGPEHPGTLNLNPPMIMEGCPRLPRSTGSLGGNRSSPGR